MPTKQPTLGWEHIRNYAEKWEWEEARTHFRRTGFNVPKGARNAHQVPFFIRCITLKGEVMTGEVVCLKVFLPQRQRLIMFTQSHQMRRICDCLIMEIDGVRFVVH